MIRTTWLRAAAICFVLGVPSAVAAQKVAAPQGNIPKWQGYKFGLLLVFGAWSQSGIGRVWEAMNPERTEAQRQDLFNLHKTFDPSAFDADQFARMSRDAGAKYVITVAKHLDGFCNYDTSTTSARITGPDTPYSRRQRPDIMANLTTALRRQGVVPGIYLAHTDWSHPDSIWSPFHLRYRPASHITDPERWRRYHDYEFAQVRELVTKYDPEIFWFDTRWPPDARPGFDVIGQWMRSHKPGIIINDRGTADFADYSTYEDAVPSQPVEGPWEITMAATRGDGFWFKGEAAEYKKAEEILEALVATVSRGGNFLLGLAPDGDGRLPDAEASALRDVGRWLQTYGEAIFGTDGARLTSRQKGIYFTRRGKSLFMIRLASAGDVGQSTIPASALSARRFGSQKHLHVASSERGPLLSMPEFVPDQLADVMTIELPSEDAPVSIGDAPSAPFDHSKGDLLKQ